MRQLPFSTWLPQQGQCDTVQDIFFAGDRRVDSLLGCIPNMFQNLNPNEGTGADNVGAAFVHVSQLEALRFSLLDQVTGCRDNFIDAQFCTMYGSGIVGGQAEGSGCDRGDGAGYTDDRINGGEIETVRVKCR